MISNLATLLAIKNNNGKQQTPLPESDDDQRRFYLATPLVKIRLLPALSNNIPPWRTTIQTHPTAFASSLSPSNFWLQDSMVKLS